MCQPLFLNGKKPFLFEQVTSDSSLARRIIMHSDANLLLLMPHRTLNPLMKMHKNSSSGVRHGRSRFVTSAHILLSILFRCLLQGPSALESSHSSANEIIMNVILFRMGRIVV